MIINIIIISILFFSLDAYSEYAHHWTYVCVYDFGIHDFNLKYKSLENKQKDITW